MQIFIKFVDSQKATDAVTKSNSTLGYIHWTGKRSIARLHVVGHGITIQCGEMRPFPFC
jgi:hypothetical protein